MSRFIFAVLMMSAMICRAQLGEGDARLQLWKLATGATNATATIDGTRVVEINGSAALADEAMAIPASTVAALLAAEQAASAAAALAPPEVDRVAYESGWSESIDTNGTPVRWRTHESPYDPAVDAANRAAALATNDLARARLRSIARQLKDTSGTQAQQLTRTRKASLDLCRWLREYALKDDLPEDAP